MNIYWIYTASKKEGGRVQLHHAWIKGSCRKHQVHHVTCLMVYVREGNREHAHIRWGVLFRYVPVRTQVPCRLPRIILFGYSNSCTTLQETADLPGAKIFAGCFLSGTRQRNSLPGARPGDTRQRKASGKSTFAGSRTLGKFQPSAKISLCRVPATRQNMAAGKGVRLDGD